MCVSLFTCCRSRPLQHRCPHRACQVWLNHHPLSLLPLPSSTAKRLLAPLPSLAINMKRSACSTATADSSYAPQNFSFGPTGSEAQLTLPLPKDVADGHGAGQSLSIRRAPSCSAALPSRRLIFFPACSYTREVKAVLAPAASKHKAPNKAASASPLQKSVAPAAGGGGKRRK